MRIERSARRVSRQPAVSWTDEEPDPVALRMDYAGDSIARQPPESLSDDEEFKTVILRILFYGVTVLLLARAWFGNG